MKVPYFDIRSHFLLWMILSKVFSMYINADRHFGIRSPPCWLQRREGLVANMSRLHAVFSSSFPRAFKKTIGSLRNHDGNGNGNVPEQKI